VKAVLAARIFVELERARKVISSSSSERATKTTWYEITRAGYHGNLPSITAPGVDTIFDFGFPEMTGL
jgi:hypothetical protein